MGARAGGRALASASGRGAITAVFESLAPGARIVVPRDSYIGTRAFLADRSGRGRFDARLADVTDTAATLAACEGAALLWIETPTNPLLGVADLPALIARGGGRGAVGEPLA